MITPEIYNEYFGSDTAPENLTRLEFISIETIKSIATQPLPKEGAVCYDNFLKAVMEQTNYFVENPDILVFASSLGGASLGKFSEGSSAEKLKKYDVTELISPLTYNILLNCGLLYAGMRC